MRLSGLYSQNGVMMKNTSKKSLFFAVSLILLVGLSGCARYKARALPKLVSETNSQFLDNKSISFAYRVFDKSDCKKYLDRDVISAGYQPVQITITNNSKRSVYFSRKNINRATVDPREVAQSVHTNTAGRATAYGIAALFAWPFAIPAVVDGVGSAQANDKLDEDFARKALDDQELKPFEIVNGLIFVPKQADLSDFQIALSEPKASQRIVLSAEKPQAKVLYA